MTLNFKPSWTSPNGRWWTLRPLVGKDRTLTCSGIWPLYLKRPRGPGPHLNQLEQFHRNSLKMLQSLSTHLASWDDLPPVQARTSGNVDWQTHSYAAGLHRFAWRVTVTLCDPTTAGNEILDSKSWVIYTRWCLMGYDLPLLHQLINCPPQVGIREAYG